MNILGNNSSKLNNVIFENRNKDYGAYEIRESYTDSLKKSLLCLGSLVSLLFGSVFIYNKVNAIPSEETAIVFNDPILEPLEYVTTVNNIPLPELMQNTAMATTAPEGGMAVRIVDDVTTATVTTNVDNPVSGVGSQTATGTASTGSETSTATVANIVIATTASVSAEPVIFAEEPPEFEGGMEGLIATIGKNIVYPELAKEAGVQGVVYVSFVVNETGKVEAAKVLKGIGLGCDEEVVRVLNKLPKWKKPGKNAGHPVKVRFNIPVAFKLK